MKTMRTTMRSMVAAGAVLMLAACQGMGGGRGDSYPAGGDPWAVPASSGGKAADSAVTPAKESPDAKGAAPSATESTHPAGDQTVLEQLETARARVDVLEKETVQQKSDIAAATALVEQLKRENENLAQLANQSQESRTGVDQELEKIHQQMKELESRCRLMADDLLSERIQRVRVERALILAKVAEAEQQDENH